jgi:hypothetical protein
MTGQKLSAAAMALVLSACAQNAKTVAPAPPAPVVMAMPAQAPALAAPPTADGATIALAERDLKSLGYPAGKSADINDVNLRRAVSAFERDQGLGEDGQLSRAVEERLKQLRSLMSGKNTVSNKRNALFVYSDGTVRNTGLSMLPPAPAGFVSDASPGLPRSMRPGSEAHYHLGHRTQDGAFVATKSISCHVGHLVRSSAAFGAADLQAVDCQVEGDTVRAWHSLYNPVLDTVAWQQGAGKSRILVAIRPSTANWPMAARTGLDWAITHALDTPATDTPVPWSSTGVGQHFEVRAFARVSGGDLGFAGKYAAASCRRFELTETERPPLHYPGIACQSANGAWTLAGTAIALSSPAIAMQTASPNPKAAADP